MREKIRYDAYLARNLSTLSSEVSPELCIRWLKTPSVQNYYGLKAILEASSTEWLRAFVQHEGIEMLFEALQHLGERRRLSFADTFMQLQCVNCVRVVMNSREGLQSVIGDTKFTRFLARGWLTTFTLSVDRAV